MRAGDRPAARLLKRFARLVNDGRYLSLQEAALPLLLSSRAGKLTGSGAHDDIVAPVFSRDGGLACFGG